MDEKGRERFHALNMKRHYLGDWSKPYGWIVGFAANELKKGLEPYTNKAKWIHSVVQLLNK